MSSVVTFHLVLVVYAIAAALFFVDLARPSAEPSRWAPRALALGAVLHVAHLAVMMTEGDGAATLKFGLSLCGASVSLAYLALKRRFRVDGIGVAVAPLSLTLLVGAEFLRSAGPETAFPRTLLLMHVAANVLGVGLFLLAGAASAFYLFQERRLKAKRVHVHGAHVQGRLPALDALDSTEHRLLLAGFPLLTFGIVSGAVFASSAASTSGAGILRAALAYATWILVASVLVLRSVAGWRGRRSAYGTLAGVACVLLVIAIYVVASAGGGNL
ncbi:MAG TPA: cytochrome c biogenesis protein CcsA [Polyangiaceae bacterium]|nr:cytochrome c biogenesis protein CcsA [Polyangiaceae bacterium]